MTAKFMGSDIEIARSAKMQPIEQVGAGLGIPADAIYRFGHHKAKLAFDYIRTLDKKPNGKLVLVTAITPTPAGEGKTTTTAGPGAALPHTGNKPLIGLRDPSRRRPRPLGRRTPARGWPRAGRPGFSCRYGAARRRARPWSSS